jgi:single-strand DNA-binding protein
MDVIHFSVAANSSRRDGDEWKTDTHWNRVTLYRPNRQHEIIWPRQK